MAGQPIREIFQSFIPAVNEPKVTSPLRQVILQQESTARNTRRGFRKFLTRLSSNKQSKDAAMAQQVAATEATFDKGTDKKPALARAWLARCVGNESDRHSQCTKRDSNYLPTRLLDLERAAATGMLRLVCPQEHPEMFQSRRTYITLSHCWGAWGAKSNPILTTSNSRDRVSNGMRVSDLPQTFQDAVEAARWFGVRWLWIDCFCILQDSSSDWTQEARLMDRTYRHALLNLSNDTGHDSRSSFFPDLINTDGTSTTPLALEINAHGVKQILHLTLMPDVYFDPILSGPSFSRAWVYRERQIARRILHFTPREMIWECCGHSGGSFASETFPHGAPFSRLFQGTAAAKFQIGRLQQGLEEGVEETHAVWNDVCEQMSAKQLTKKSDLPIVLSSLAEEFQGFSPGEEYVCGFWRSMLPFELLWKRSGSKRKTIGDGELPLAPSWSWLSAGTVVTLASRGKLQSRVTTRVDYVAEIEDVSIIGTEGDPFGPVESGALELKTVVRKVCLQFEEGYPCVIINVLDEIGGEDDEGGEASRSVWRKLGPSWTQDQGDYAKVELDGYLEDWELESYFAFVTYEWFNPSNTSGHRSIEGLLLKKVQGPNDNKDETYERIGTLMVDDLYALMMRYRVDDSNPRNVDVEAEQHENRVSANAATTTDEMTDEGDYWEEWKTVQWFLTFSNDAYHEEERDKISTRRKKSSSSDTSMPQRSSISTGGGSREAGSLIDENDCVKREESVGAALETPFSNLNVSGESRVHGAPNEPEPSEDGDLDTHASVVEDADRDVDRDEAESNDAASSSGASEQFEDENPPTGLDALYQYDWSLNSALKMNKHVTKLSKLETRRIVIV